MTWTTTDWSFSCLKDMGSWGSGVCCDLSRLSPGFDHANLACYSEFLSVLLDIPQSATFLWRLHVLHILLLWLSWCLFIAFLPLVFPVQFIQIGPVCLGNANEKQEFVSDVGLMMIQVAVFFFLLRNVLGRLCCFLLQCLCDMWRNPCQMTRPP